MATLSVSYEAELYHGYPGEEWSIERSDHPDQILNGLIDDLFPDLTSCGSGMGFGRRDVQFAFDNSSDAERAWEYINIYCPFPVQLNGIYK